MQSRKLAAQCCPTFSTVWLRPRPRSGPRADSLTCRRFVARRIFIDVAFANGPPSNCLVPGELELIEWIAARQAAGGLVRVAAGDDLAVLDFPGGELLLVGVDQVLDGVHFDSSVHDPQQIGRKVMNRNLSDCAAMACLPAAAVATVALPRGTSMDYARDLYAGMKEAAEAFSCAIVGGDTAAWDGKLVLTVSILGRSAGIAPVLRKGARAGDLLCVTGPLGGSLLGRHMDFAPRIELARTLAATGNVAAMIDISDGLSRDLGHLCKASGVGAVVRADALPVHADAVALSQRDGVMPLDHALHDGEDHELLLAWRLDSPPPPPLMRIGSFTSEAGIWLEQHGRRRTLEPGGWEHSF